MIRINLVRACRSGSRAAKTLVSPREAVTGGVLLVVAFGMLFYLASRPKPESPKAEKAEKVVKVAPAQPPPAAKEEPPKVEPPQPEPKVEPPAPVEKAKTEVPPVAAPAEGCRISEVSVEKSGGSVAVVVRANAGVKYRGFELLEPDRIAVDVAGCLGNIPKAQASQVVEDPVVQKVRASQFRDDVFRVVVDVAKMPRYQIRAIEKGVEIQVLGAKP